MEKKNSRKLMDKKVQMFKRLNVNKSVSMTLICLSENGEATSKMIEGMTGLKQPEVSNAVKELTRLKWIASTKVRTPTAGRPVKYYRLAKPITEIIDMLEKKERERINATYATIEHLKELLTENQHSS